MSTTGGRSSRNLCPRFSHVIREAREKSTQRKDRPQPWIVRKLAIGLVVGIVGYAYYVYVVTFCIPMIQRHRNALGNKRIGIAFLVTFNVLFLMFVWAYVKAVITSPGYALEHTHKTPPPVPHSPEQPFQMENTNSMTGFSSQTPDDGEPHHPTAGNNSGEGNQNDSGSHQTTNINIMNMTEADQYSRPYIGRQQQQHSQQREAASASASAAVFAPVIVDDDDDDVDGDPQMIPADAALPPVAAGREEEDRRLRTLEEDRLPPPDYYSRRPPTHPVLSPEFRYCSRDGIVKPMRSHHCRACGTCVLKYDHHCPWIGQCVGARNQKFFINFLQWASLFTLFIFISVLVMYARLASLSPKPPVNPQHFVILGLSFLFALFPVLLFINQVYLTVYNITTVEQLHMQRMKEREKGMLGEMIGNGRLCSSASPVFASVSGSARTARRSQPQPQPDSVDFKRPRWPWQATPLRNEIRKRWDHEWGKLSTEGNLWWLGCKRANWEAVMGKSKWGWFCMLLSFSLWFVCALRKLVPVGHSLGDGLEYPRNPRFDPDGRWRRRSEWPDGLQ